MFLSYGVEHVVLSLVPHESFDFVGQALLFKISQTVANLSDKALVKLTAFLVAAVGCPVVDEGCPAPSIFDKG